MGMMDQCMDAMGSMTGGAMGNDLLFAVLVVLLFVWLVGLAVVGGLGAWAYRRLRTQT